MLLTILLAALATPPRHVVVAHAESLAVTIQGAHATGGDVVLVPGLLGGAYTWRHVASRLVTRGYRVVIIEPLGTGASSHPAHADYRLEQQARRLLAVFDTLGLERPTVAAHGIAASIALRMALLAPERIRRLVSVEGGPAERAASASVGRALHLSPLIKLAGAGRVLRGRIASGLAAASADDSWVTDDLVDRYAAGPLRDPAATLTVMRRMAAASTLPPVVPRLADLATPTCLVLGASRHESGPPLEEVLLMADRIQSFRVRHVPGAGHYVQEEAPDAVVTALVG